MLQKTLLWLDDERDPTYGEWLINYAPEYAHDQNSVIWIEDYTDFCEYITIVGIPDMIAFDHDLGEESLTGYDCAKWLVNYCIDNDLELPKYTVQSANPVGRDNINGIFLSFLKYCSK